MDSCDDVAFSGYLAERAAKIDPEQYILSEDNGGGYEKENGKV